MERSGFKLLWKGFKDPNKEERFLKSKHNPREMRQMIIASVLMFLFYLIFDYLLFPDLFLIFLLIRCGIFVPTAMICYRLTFTRVYWKKSRLIILILGFVASFCVIILEYLGRENPYAPLYFFGIGLVAVFIYGTGKISPALTVGFGLVMFLGAVLVDSLFVEEDPLRALLKASLLFSMMLTGFLTSTIIHQTSRQSFESQIKIEEMSMTDPLTGLRNRLFFEELVKPTLLTYVAPPERSYQVYSGRRSDDKPGESLILGILDIDRFKSINDHYGHEGGDLFLKEFSKRLISAIRTDDDLIRWGGEEFLLILHHADPLKIGEICVRIGAAVSSRPYFLKGKPCGATVSGGVLVIPPHSGETHSSVDLMIDWADKALYHSKHSGRDRFTEAVVENGTNGISLEMKPL